ncbi:MAG: class I SAM-dependent methyltransferase [Pseudomonadota bacterium]
MTKKYRSEHQLVDKALNLDGDPEHIRQFYDDWAKNYDKDVADIDYVGPRLVGELVAKHTDSLDEEVKAKLNVLDAGCGTGLVGRELHRSGFTQIDGFDLSGEMAEQAAHSGIYKSAIGGVDIMKAEDHYASGSFDIIVCVGVFTLGHVPPEALEVLVRLARKGCLVFITTRTQYYDETNYQDVADRLIESGRMKLVESVERAHYIGGSRSHFWVYRVDATGRS